jgi:plasmid maintenance system antidote protein VapI
MEMYSKTLLDEYLKAKKFTQYKQAAAELGFSTAYIAKVNTGREEFTEETAVCIAVQCGMDPQEVVMRLAEARAKTPEVKSVWVQVLKRYCAGREAASCAGLSAIAALSIAKFNFALCILC